MSLRFGSVLSLVVKASVRVASPAAEGGPCHLGGWTLGAEADDTGIAGMPPRNMRAVARMGVCAQGAKDLGGRAIVALGFGHCVFPDSFLDGLLEHGGLEQGGVCRDAENGLVGLEDHAGHAHVKLFAGF